MITDKKSLRVYLKSDMAFYYAFSKRERFVQSLLQDPITQIAKYVRCLRKEEYYHNVRHDPIGKLAEYWWLGRKNRLGNKLGFKIPCNCFGPGLTIYHHGEIIVNESARIGADCRLHGGNCIGNSGKTDEAPIIGDGLDLGIGAKIIGGVTLGNNVTVGANAVVTKSFEQDGVTLLGIPAKPKN